MQNFIAVISITISCAGFLTTALNAQPPEVSGYQINWFDEFDGNSLDTSKWTAIFSTNPTNNSLHAYLPGNVLVGGGNLSLLSSDQPFGQFAYRSGQIISTAAQRHGRFEVRGKLPTSRGMWPAIWLLPDAAWPSQGEIDIMENRGDQPFLTSSAFHWGTNPPFNHSFVFTEQETFVDANATNYHDSFHTYAAEWDPTQIRFYVDGVHHYTVRNGDVDNFLTNSQSAPMRLIINTAIGGDFLANPDESTQWPQLFEVDYAYLYNRVGDPELDLENGGFDLNVASLAAWKFFGNGADNVRAVTGPTDSGTGALKLYGQFVAGTNFSGVEQGISVEAGDQIEIKCRSYVDSADSISGTANVALLKFDFYNTLYGAFDTSEYISSEEIIVADGGTQNNQWIEHTLTATVPTGAIEARVAIVFAQSNFDPGAVFIDSAEFTNLSADEELVADIVSVNTGTVATGDVAATHQSDDQRFEILAIAPANSQSPIDVVFETVTAISNPTSIQLAFESSANSSNLDQTIEAFNYTSGQFEVISTDAMDFIDLNRTFTLSGNLSRFVRAADGQMRIKARYDSSGTVLMFPWKSRIDALSWTVGQ